MSQERFTTSREVYHRIRWDPRLDAREFSIGYDAHLEALEEMPFEAFVPDGEIPWHRVWYFKRGRQVVWDRRQRLDLLDSLTPPAQEPAPAPAPVAVPEQANVAPGPAVPASSRTGDRSAAPGFTPLPAYRFDARANAWVESTGTPPAPGPEQLTVVTFNVLFDLHDAELLATERRTPATLAQLRATDADVIALQEVTAPFLRALLDAPWVREGYWLSEGPGATTVTPYGQVLLSRFPFSTLGQHVFTRDKRIIAARLAVAGNPLWVATQHLTSNRAPSGASARAAQVQLLVDWTRSLGTQDSEGLQDVVLAGDFNFGDGEPEAEAFSSAGFVDAWPALRPGESGETYDPVLNAVAALTTSSGRRQRLDRVLVCSPAGRLTPEAVELFGEAPLEGPPAPAGEALFLSDHFGLRCVLRRSNAPQPGRAPPRPRPAALVHHTAVVLIPPEAVWEPIQALRRKHDSKFTRWMPHITLLYPFVPEEFFDEAEALIADALHTMKSFEVTLTGFHHFEHRANATAWLRPEDRPFGALKSLHAALEQALPECTEQGHKSARGFTPHLSVGQLPRSSAADIARTLSAWGKHWRPLTFEAREVCIIRRKGDTPFEVVRRIPLAGKQARPHSPSPVPPATAAGDPTSTARSSPAPDAAAPTSAARKASPTPDAETRAAHEDALLRAALSAHGAGEAPEARSARTAAVEQLQSFCAQVGAELHPYGSYLLGTDGPGSDVDAVAIGPSSLSREDFARALLQELTRQPGATARFVADAAIPLVKLSLGGVSFDVSYASRPEGVAPCPPETLLEHHSEGLDVPGLRSVLGLADTRGLLDELARADANLERFRTLLRAVKAWAKARGLYSHALGYLGGLSWSILAAWACTRVTGDAAASDAALLARFFETFATWRWPQPVTLTPETSRYRPDGKRDLMPIIAPASPPRNTARNVSRSTVRTLRDELTRAHEVVARARAEATAESWAALFEPQDWTNTPPARLVLSIDAPTPEAREAAAGWVLGHLTALVYRLEGDRRLFMRPLPFPGPHAPFVVGLETRNIGTGDVVLRRHGFLFAAVEEFRDSFRDWSNRPEGTSLRVGLIGD
ncbi:poly(A) polymerase [Pyxidicoccus sp. 3LG]